MFFFRDKKKKLSKNSSISVENNDKNESVKKDSLTIYQKTNDKLSDSLAPPNKEENGSSNTNVGAHEMNYIKQKHLPSSSVLSSESFFFRFVKLIKSSETVMEVQPLVQDLQNS